MNVVKIQQDLIKDALNDKAKKNRWGIQVMDSEVAIMTKYNVYLLDPNDFMLDAGKLVDKGVVATKVVESVFNNSDNAKATHKTGVLKVLKSGGKDITCIELKIDDSDEMIYLDQSLVKYYDKSAEYEAINGKSPAYVYENDILVGVVLPVKSEV